MDHYFFKINISYTDKNNLYKQFRKFAQSVDGTLIIGKDNLKAFKKELKDKLLELHLINKRCKAFDVQMHHHSPDKTLSVYVSGSWSASIYKVNHFKDHKL